MTNMQLYLAIGIPALLILSNTGVMFFLFSQNNGRFDQVDGRFDRQDGRFDRIEGRLDRIESDLRQFYAVTGGHTEAIDMLKKRL